MTVTPPDKVKSFAMHLNITMFMGAAIAYFGFSNGWPPPILLLITGIAGIVLVASAAPAAYTRSPLTHTVFLAGSSGVATWGIIFEVILFRRMGLHIGLIYPFGLFVFALVANVFHLIKPQTKELFGIPKTKPLGPAEPEAPPEN